MRKAGVERLRGLRAARSWRRFADKPISFEVFADDTDGMRSAGARNRRLGDNVYVKMPVTNTGGEPSTDAGPRARRRPAVKVNVTAICTLDQVRAIASALAGGPPSVISVFAGPHRRHRPRPDPADDAMPWQSAAQPTAAFELLLSQPARGAQHRAGRGDRLRHHHGHGRPAGEAGPLIGKELAAFGLETVQMFYRDAAGGRVQAVSDAELHERATWSETVSAPCAPWTQPPSRPSPPAWRASASGGGRLFILGVGGSAGAREPRGQRLPQDLRLRGVHTDRQRVRADRARERRRLGHQLFPTWLEGLAPRHARRASWCSRSAAATRRRTCRRTWCRALELAARAGRARSSASSAATGAPPARRPRRAYMIPTVSPDRITPHTEGLCAVVWHLLVSHPALKRAATKWESTKCRRASEASPAWDAGRARTCPSSARWARAS